MTFQELKKQILDKKIACNKLILYSKDQYSINSVLVPLKELIQTPELNITEIDGDSIEDISIIINACETLPFMSSKKLVIIRAPFLGEDSKDKNSIVKDLSKYIKNIPDSTILVLYFYQKDKRENINKNTKVSKLIKSGAVLVSNSKNQYSDIKEIIKNSDIKLSNEVNSYIVSNVENLDLFKNDLNKLKFIDNIDIETVKGTFSSLNQDDVFDLTDAINKKDGITSLDLFNNLVAKGEMPISILFMLIRQFKLLFYSKIASMQNISSDDFAKKFKLHPYVCKLLYEQNKNFKLELLERDLKLCIDLEIKLKTVSSPDVKAEIEMLIIKCLMTEGE